MVCTSTASSTTEQAAIPHTIHRRLIKNSTPFLYLPTKVAKAVLNERAKRCLNVSGAWPDGTSSGRSSRAHKAGLRVRALKAEMPTATAMVNPNWV